MNQLPLVSCQWLLLIGNCCGGMMRSSLKKAQSCSQGMIDVTSSRIIAPLWTREKAPFHFVDAEEEVP